MKYKDTQGLFQQVFDSHPKRNGEPSKNVLVVERKANKEELGDRGLSEGSLFKSVFEFV